MTSIGAYFMVLCLLRVDRLYVLKGSGGICKLVKECRKYMKHMSLKSNYLGNIWQKIRVILSKLLKNSITVICCDIIFGKLDGNDVLNIIIFMYRELLSVCGKKVVSKVSIY